MGVVYETASSEDGGRNRGAEGTLGVGEAEMDGGQRQWIADVQNAEKVTLGEGCGGKKDRLGLGMK